jgi:hypothetical protein
MEVGPGEKPIKNKKSRNQTTKTGFMTLKMLLLNPLRSQLPPGLIPFRLKTRSSSKKRRKKISTTSKMLRGKLKTTMMASMISKIIKIQTQFK